MESKNFFTKPINVFIIAIVCTFLWGSAFPMIKIGYKAFGIESNDTSAQMFFAGVRFAFAGMMVLIFGTIAQKKPLKLKREEVKPVLLLGIIQTAIQYIFFYISLNYLTGVKASIINSSGNFFAVILAHFFFKDDKLNIEKAIGCILGFCGVVLCNIGKGFDGFGFTLRGEGFLIIAALSFAIGSVITKLTAQNKNIVAITGYQLLLGGIILWTTGMLKGGAVTLVSIKACAVLVYLALLSAVAFTLWSQLLKYNFVGKIAIYGFLNPIFGVILSGILLGDNLKDPKIFLALLLVSVGIFVVNKKDKDSEVSND